MQIVTMEDIDNGVSSIIAGTNVTVSPPSGTGDVTVNASGGGGGNVIVPVSGTTPVSSGAGCNFTTVSSAQILALLATPVTILGAPGAHNIIYVMGVTLENIFNTTPYANLNGDGIGFSYGGAASANGTNILNETAVLLTAGSSKILPEGNQSVPGGVYPSINPYATAAIVNQSVTLINTSAAAYTDGDGTLRVTIYYIVVPTTS